VPHEGLSGTLERLTSLRNTTQTMLEKRIKPLSTEATRAQVNPILKWSEALDELNEKISRLEQHLASAPVDSARLNEIAQAATAFNRRAARWPDKVTTAQLRALSRQLDEFLQ
jgi:hypothetical protein